MKSDLGDPLIPAKDRREILREHCRKLKRAGQDGVEPDRARPRAAYLAALCVRIHSSSSEPALSILVM